MSLRVVPLTLAQANAFVDAVHRHHDPVTGHKWSIGAERDGVLVGAAIAGRPVARGLNGRAILDVCRLATDGSPHVCSKLYSACARAAEAMGYGQIQTYILDSEPGTSLIAAGWRLDRLVKGRPWKHTTGPRKNSHPTCDKQCWVKDLNPR